MSGARLDLLAPWLLDAILAQCAEGAPQALALAAVLARADFAAIKDFDADVCLLTLLGGGRLAIDPQALAGILARADFDLAETPHDRLCAEPVHLRADATRVVLFDAATVGLDADEADALIAHLNAGLADCEPLFVRGHSPQRWYLTLPGLAQLGLASPRRLRGCQVEDSLAALRRLGPLNRLMTEAQMLLYDAPVNQVRVAAGRAPINSVWLWGAGPPPTLAASALALVAADDDVALACARHAGVACSRDLDALAPVLAAASSAIAVLASGADGGFDLERCARAVLAPACAALARGQLQACTVHTRHGRLDLTPRSRWRWWRRPQPGLARLRLELAPAAID